MRLVVTNNQAQNPQSVDLTQYIVVNDTTMDPANPAFTTKVISHSLLREGGVLALEDFKNKELVFPLTIGPFVSGSAMAQYLSTLNQIITTAGATAAWTDEGMSQPTYFDLISSQLDVEYSFRRGQNFYTNGKLRLFAQPFGRTAGPRPYAAASSLGPLLMISPYLMTGPNCFGPGPGGAPSQVIGASTQAGNAGFGGNPFGNAGGAGLTTIPSAGVFYPGRPSLAGDAPALLTMSVTVGGSGLGTASVAAVSLLPDPMYQVMPLLAAGTSTISNTASGVRDLQLNGSASTSFYTSFQAVGVASEPTAAWAGQHRMLALAKASGGWGQIYSVASGPVGNAVVASVAPGPTWQVYDLGTYALKASEPPGLPVYIGGQAGAGVALQLNAIVTLPDASTWLFNRGTTSLPAGGDTLILDDGVQDQFLLNLVSSTSGASFYPMGFAPSPVGIDSAGLRITPYSRGLAPRPDPKNGLPILAVLGLSSASFLPTQPMSAQVQVTERARYVLP